MTAPSPDTLDTLARIEEEVRHNLAAPQRDTLAFLNDALGRLKGVPLAVDPRTRIECLLSAAQQFFHQGQSVFSAVEPVAVAVMLARDLGDDTLLRRALTFQGIILSATGNPADALRAHMEALELAEALGDDAALSSSWSNIGLALYDAALYRDSVDSSQKAAEIALGNPKLRLVRANALGNIALCCLHMRDYQTGLANIQQSISLMPPEPTPSVMLSRVLAESVSVRLLLAQGQIAEAAERSQLATESAAGARSITADISAACSVALVEVYQGLTDQGLSRAVAALEKARAVRPSLRETLLALIQAHEQAGRHDRALALHRELTLHIRKAQHENIVRHHQMHLQRIETHQELQYPEALLGGRDAELSSKLGDEVGRMRQGDLLEQYAVTSELRDDPTGEHCYRVARLAALLARAHGEDAAFCHTLELAARLHDIGKVAIPDSVLQKPTALTDGERAILETHAATGGDLLSKTKVEYATVAEDVARHHHERWDGGGYPDGISGTGIPFAARLVALADSFDSLTHSKPYRRAWTADEAINEILRQKGLQFDPKLTDLFVPLIERLRAEHADLDAFLGQAAQASAIKLARKKIAASLARPLPPRRQPPVGPH